MKTKHLLIFFMNLIIQPSFAQGSRTQPINESAQVSTFSGNLRPKASSICKENNRNLSLNGRISCYLNDFSESRTAHSSCNSSVHLDGVDDYLNTGNDAAYNLFGANQPVTITCYVKLDSLLTQSQSSSMVVIAKGAWSAITSLGNKYLGLAYENITVPQFHLTLYDLPIQNEVFSDPSFILAPHTWYEVTVVRDVNIKMYINGTDVTYNPNNSGWSHDYNPVLSGTDMYFGLQHNVGPGAVDNNFFRGNLDEIRIWNRALSQVEIQNRYQTNLFPASETGLVGYWKFDEDSDLVANNSSSTNIPAILYNGVMWSNDVPFFSSVNSDTIVGIDNVTQFQITNYSINLQPGLNYNWQVLNGTIQSGQNTNSIVVKWDNLAGVGHVIIEATKGSCSFTDTLLVKIGTCNSSVHLDGVDDYLNTGNDVAYDIFGANQPVTITCYVKLDSLLTQSQSSSMVVIAKGAWSAITSLGNKYLGLAYENITVPQFHLTLYDLPIQNEVFSDPSFILAPHTWYEVTVVRDVNIKMYINGTDVTYNPNNSGWSHDYNPVLSGTDMYFGLQHNVGPGAVDNNFFRGNLDEIRIWNRALSQVEIQNRYQTNLFPVSETGLVGYWKFDEDSDLVANNSSSTNVSAILYNGVTWSKDAPFLSSVNSDTIVGTGNVVQQQLADYSVNQQPGLNYNWNVLNGTIQSGQNTNSISVEWGNLLGLGSVIIEASNGTCSFTDTMFVQIGVNGIHENDEAGTLVIYPNPAKNKINIEFKDFLKLKKANLIITDRLGEIVKKVSYSDNNQKKIYISVDDLSNGVYFLNLITGNQIMTEKFLIIK